MHVGPPEIEARTQGWNWGLYSVFEDRAALDKYAVSDAHTDCVKEHVRPYMDGESGRRGRTRHGVEDASPCCCCEEKRANDAEVMAYDWEISDKSGY